MTEGQKLTWFGHVTCHDHLSQTILHLGRWVMSWSAQEMLEGQHQTVDIPSHARIAHDGLLQKRLEVKEDLCCVISHVLLMIQSVKGLN